MERRFEIFLLAPDHRHVSHGMARHIRGLKPEAKAASTEEVSWNAIEQILKANVEGYPELFNYSQLSSIRSFHKIRWQLKEDHVSVKEISEAAGKFMEEHPDEDCDFAYGVITQAYRSTSR